jgi:predicted choloylglycine hydrolase
MIGIIVFMVWLFSDQLELPGATFESCTIFTVHYGDTVLFGNNEDYNNPNTYYWVSPSTMQFYGGVYVGYDNFDPQGGINEKGLSFDYNALPKVALNSKSGLPPLHGNPGFIILRECTTVKEAIELAKSYNWGTSLSYQIHLADATGDAVVISAGPDGELAFERKEKGDRYLVSTNFNLAHHQKNEREGLCRRYDTAVEMLEKIEDENDVTVEYTASILDAVHAEGAKVNTLYSNVFDLKNGIIYLYYWHQFDEVVTLIVADEIAKNPDPTRIKDLFSQKTVDQASREYSEYQTKERGGGCLGTAFMVVLLVITILLLPHKGR